MVKQQSLKESSFVKSERAQIKSKTYEIKLSFLSSRLFRPPSLRLTERINSARYLSRSSGVIADNSRSSFLQTFYVSLRFSLCVFVFKTFGVYSSTEESWITKRISLMAFAETGTFNINDGRNANKNYLLSSDSQIDGLCGVRNRANQP